jgi:drug/metabolite transporter (DMT)-like permease
VPVALALLSSLLWGTSDFLGGTASRRAPALAVVAFSQLTALVLLVPVAALFGSAPQHVWQGLLAGLVGAVGLGAFYAALAAGTMGVVAPIAATGALLPVVVGLARGESPSVGQVVGIVVALVGVVLASGPELSGGASARPLLLAVLAALGFGTVIVLLADGSKGQPGAVVVTLLLMRSASVVAMGPLVYVRKAASGLRPHLSLIAAVGIGDVAANACFAYSTRGSLLSVVAVLGSLYPVVTVVLARQIHGERLLPIQVTGAAATLVGVVVLSAS